MILRRLVSISVGVALACSGCGPEDDGGASESNDGSEAGSGSASESDGSTTATSVGTAEGSGSGTSASTTNATSTITTAGTSTSDGAECDPFPSEGDLCSVPGAYCSSDCSDQCQFCNILECRDGAWGNAEVFPVPCLECEPLCELSVAAGCAAGAPDQAACVTGCQEIMAGPCSIEHSDTRACAGETPTFTCDAEGRPIVAGCEDDFTALYACLGL